MIPVGQIAVMGDVTGAMLILADGTQMQAAVDGRVRLVVVRTLAEDPTIVQEGVDQALATGLAGRDILQGGIGDDRVALLVDDTVTDAAWGIRSKRGFLAWNAVDRRTGGPMPHSRKVIAKQSGHVFVPQDGLSGAMDKRRRGSEALTVGGKITAGVLRRWAMRFLPLWFSRGREITVTPETLEATLQAIEADAVNGWWYDIFLTPGVYSLRERIPPTRVRLISPVRYGARIRLENPDTVSVAVANTESPIWPIHDIELVGLEVSVKNGRYAAHHDQDATNVNTRQVTTDCRFVHEGNTVPGSWTAPPAWGSGTARGLVQEHTRTTFQAKGHAFAVHSNRPFLDRPSVSRLTECVLEPGGALSMLVASLGSQTTDRLELVNCKIGGHYIRHEATPWRATDGSAPHVEFAITLLGCDVMGWEDTTGSDYYPSQPDKELVATASGPIAKWQALVFDGARNVVKVAPTDATADQFVGVALNAAAAGERVRVLREAKLFPGQTQTGGAWTFDQKVYLSPITPGAFWSAGAPGAAPVGVGVGALNIIHIKGRS